MTEAEIIAWTEEAGRRIEAGEVQVAPLTAKQRARIKAAEMRATGQLTSTTDRLALKEGRKRA